MDGASTRNENKVVIDVQYKFLIVYLIQQFGTMCLPVKLLVFSLSLFCRDTCSFSSSSCRKSRDCSSMGADCPTSLQLNTSLLLSSQHKWALFRKSNLFFHLYFILVCEGMSRLEYCFERAERSPSPLPLPPLAGSNVGLAAVVILFLLLLSLNQR